MRDPNFNRSHSSGLPSTIIIGAGPAGLTAAYILAKAGAPVTVLEADSTYVGGISRTVCHGGFRFDIGGHRFFSKATEIERLWDEILPKDMLTRPRSSRIFYRGKFFSYPLRTLEALRNLGMIESVLCGLSYLRARIFPFPKPRNFEQWVTNQFGARLFRIFFKTYTEKVWGMSCRRISADWAAQRIKGLSLASALLNAIAPRRSGNRGATVKTLIHSFRYPRRGPGMMWEACAEKVRFLGGTVALGQTVIDCERDHATSRWRVTHRATNGRILAKTADHVISSAPIRALADMLSPSLSDRAKTAANALKYRDFVTVALICEGPSTFSDNWIYVHEPLVQVGRIQNFESWSPEMVPGDGRVCYGLEYFCQEGDKLWALTDAELVALATFEMEWLGLIGRKRVLDGCVVRQPKAYPVYDDDYARHVATIRAEIDGRFPGLHLVGRNGMHKYNNQDHSMMTAMLCAKNILAGEALYDVWAVNGDAEYHESARSSMSSVTSQASDGK